MEDPDEEIPNMFEGIDINNGPFTMEEYHKVKTMLNSFAAHNVIYYITYNAQLF
jgi:hypothetical protein